MPETLTVRTFQGQRPNVLPPDQTCWFAAKLAARGGGRGCGDVWRSCCPELHSDPVSAGLRGGQSDNLAYQDSFADLRADNAVFQVAKASAKPCVRAVLMRGFHGLVDEGVAARHLELSLQRPRVYHDGPKEWLRRLPLPGCWRRMRLTHTASCQKLSAQTGKLLCWPFNTRARPGILLCLGRPGIGTTASFLEKISTEMRP